MSDVALLGDDGAALAATVIDAWISTWLDEGTFLLAAERQKVTDGSGSARWYLRFAGEEKDAITVWATLRQRTLHTEVQLMATPEENLEEVYAYLLRCNAEMYGMAYAFGPDDALYLMGRTSAVGLEEGTLDRVFGSAVHYVDRHYPIAMALGFPAWYRRRPARNRSRSGQ